MPSTMATYVYASSQGHSARTKIFCCDDETKGLYQILAQRIISIYLNLFAFILSCHIQSEFYRHFWMCNFLLGSKERS